MKNLNEYINHFRENENIFYLNKKGRELIGHSKVVTKTLNYRHILMRNDIYIHYGNPKLWQNEHTIPTPEFKIVTDAIFNVKGVQYFLEVDHMQKMNANFEKLSQYARFKEMGIWQKWNGGRFPILIFYTATQARKWQMQEKKPDGIELITFTKKDLVI